MKYQIKKLEANNFSPLENLMREAILFRMPTAPRLKSKAFFPNAIQAT